MSRLAGFTYRDVVSRLKALGFVFDREARGSHEIWYSPSARRRTTIPHHPGTVPVGTLRAILREAGISPDEFLSDDGR